MAYRRRQGGMMGRSSTFKEEIYHPTPSDDDDEPSSFHQHHSTSSSASTLATQAIRASAAHRDSSHSSAYYAPFKDYPSKVDISTTMDNPTLRKGLDALTSSMNRIGGTIGNALEEGRSIVENKTADFIQETRKIQIRRKGNINSEDLNFGSSGGHGHWHQSTTTQTQNHTSHEDQLKASRDVAMATAAKAKLLLRELKTVKADLAFAKQRSSQLEEENKMLRDAREKGVNPADDDMIRLQLETLLAEKARLAHENSVYARENRFLREIVEYHQLTMQDVVYLDEGIEEVTEVYPVSGVSRMLSVSPPSPSSSSPPSPSQSSSSHNSLSTNNKEMVPPDIRNNTQPAPPLQDPTTHS